ncbi:protein pxr1-like [Nicotiana sylvestris]|uniref:protein pxr1-like n=1 Tax=Nicotiana sylvestris TaxID=4096 RepID=UPI00388C62FB
MVSSKTKQVTYGPKVTPETISEVAMNLESRFVLVGSIPGVETTKSERVGESGAMSVWGEESVGMEEGMRKIGGSGSEEAVEGLVQLGNFFDEPVPSEQETLVDLLKRVAESYNLKKKGSSGVKTPSTARENKKRKAVSYILVKIPPIRGRAKKSQKKQSEAELEKALEESKRKATAKGKKKVVEPVEAVEIDKMYLALRDEDETEEVEVLTPNAKKAKTSTKKSISKSKSVEPSTLASEMKPLVR